MYQNAKYKSIKKNNIYIILLIFIINLQKPQMAHSCRESNTCIYP